MNLFNIKILLSSFLSLFFQLINYKVLNDKFNIKISFKKIFFILIIFWLIILNSFYNTDIFKPPIAFLFIMIANKVMYRDPYTVVINTTVVSYVIVLVCEIVLSMFFLLIGFELELLKDSAFFVFIFTICTNLVSFIFCRYIKFIKNFVSKLNEHSLGRAYKYIIIVMFLEILLIIDFRNIFTPSVISYIVSILLVILIFIIFISYLNDEFRISTELKKVDVLLENITNYEEIIDNNRMNSHEMLNNLVLLKSFDDKNTQEYSDLLNELIKSYDKSGNSIKNISLLPKGLKGIIYYKTNDLSNKGINVTIDISKRVSNSLAKIEHDDFVILCRCVPILLDNAIEACLNSLDKNLIVSIYLEKNNIIVSIENSSKEVVNIEFINDKNFSTKGENRGLGLYILNNLLSKSERITLNQEFIGNYFVSRLIIKK